MIGLHGLLLVLLCALGWAGLDLLRKLLAGHAAPVPSSLLLVAGQIPLFVLWAALDGESWAGGGASIGSGYWLPGLVSIGINLLANVAFMQSVRVAPMSRTVPLLSLTPVFATLFAVPTLGEWPSPGESLGVVLVVATAFVIAHDSSGSGAAEESPSPGDPADLRSGSSKAGAGRLPPWLARGWQHGGILMAFVALCWSITPTLDKLAMQHTSPALHALVLVVGIALGLALVLWQQDRLGEVRDAFSSRTALVLGVSAVIVGALASAIQLLALQQAPVGVVETVKRGLGASLALFFGALIFSEQVGWRRILAVVVMIVGVAMVLLAVA